MRYYSLFYLAIIALACVFGLTHASALEWDPDTLLKAYINENYPWAEIEMNNLVFSGKVPEEAPVRIMVEKGPPGRTIFSLEFRTGQKIKATAEVKALDWIVMSARAFKKGYRIQEGDIYTKLTDATRIPSGAVKSADLVVGKLLTRSLIVNTPLLSSMVSDMPLVKKGQRVTLIIDSPHFRMTAPGEMREGSYIGNYVKAFNIASKKPVTGLLVDESTVKIEF